MLNIRKAVSGHYYLATALLMFLSFPNYDFVFFKICALLAWVFLVPLLLGIREKSYRDVMFIAFVTGLIGNFLTYGWIGNFGAKEPGGYFVIVFFLIPSLSVFFTIKFIAAEYFSRRFPALRLLVYPSVWVIIDFIQSIGFLAFPWPYIGYSQYNFISFIQAASVAGILGINFIMIFFNVCTTELIVRAWSKDGLKSVVRSRQAMAFACAVVFVLAVTAAGRYRIYEHTHADKGKGLKVAIVQTCISPWDYWEFKKYFYLSELFRHTNGALKDNPDLIIWSESATLEYLSFRSQIKQPDEFYRRLSGYISSSGTALLTGEIGFIPKDPLWYLRGAGIVDGWYTNNAVLFNSSGGVVQTYPKINLVPFGEWFPYEKWLPFIKRLASYYGGSDFIPGKNPEMFSIDGRKFGALVCYEGIFYRLCRRYGRMGADFLVNITNDGWTDSYGGHYQHFSASVFRAVENGLWVVRAGNDGVSAVIDPEGRVTATMPYLKKGYMTGYVYPERNVKTLYSSAGDVILHSASVFIFVLCLMCCMERIKKTAGNQHSV